MKTNLARLFRRSRRSLDESQLRELVRSAYLTLLGREPDPQGLAHWLAFLRRGGSYDALLDGFLHSPEYGRRDPHADAERRRVQAALQDGYQRGWTWGEQLKSEVPDVPPVFPDNPMAAYFNAHTQGPGIWKIVHYFELYHRHFRKFVGREVHVLEIGVFSGGSLGMWRDYFGPGCRVYGVDVLPECRKHEKDGVRIFIGSQGDRAFWKDFRAQVPAIDIVIDDGSHVPEHQIVTLEEMLPHVRPGGVYLCEDIFGEANPFHDYVAGLTRHLNALGANAPGVKDHHEGSLRNALQRKVHSVHQYPYVTVLETHETPVGQFAAPFRGSEWEWEAWQRLLKQ